MKKLLATLATLLALIAPAAAQQSTPNWSYGYVPTAAEWNYWFGKKVDWTGAAYCSVAGCQMTGQLQLSPSTATNSSMNIPAGVAPSPPNPGDVWATGTSTFFQGPITSTVNANSGPATSYQILAQNQDNTTGRGGIEVVNTNGGGPFVLQQANNGNAFIQNYGTANFIRFYDANGTNTFAISGGATGTGTGLQVVSNASGGNVGFTVIGGSANEGINFNPKGTGNLALNTNGGTVIANGPVQSGSVASGILGKFQMLGSTSGSSQITVTANGSLSLANNQGNQNTVINDGGNGSAFVIGTAGGAIANKLTAVPSTTGNAPALTASGSDTNVSLNLTTQGTGNVISNGGFLAGTPLGYRSGAGAGGTVTQATSRTTGVTLNTPTGDVTMFSAAGSATPASFTVTNSAVLGSDTIILNIRSGSSNVYNLMVTTVAAGSFTITYWTTGGTATDAPVIAYSIIRGQVN